MMEPEAERLTALKEIQVREREKKHETESLVFVFALQKKTAGGMLRHKKP